MLKTRFIFSLYSTDPDRSEPLNEASNTDANSSTNELKDVSDVLQPSLEEKEKLDFSKDSKEIKSLTIKDKLFNIKLNEQIGLLGLGLGVSLWLIILLYRLVFQRKFY